MKITKEEKIILKANRFSNAFLFLVTLDRFVVRSDFLVIRQLRSPARNLPELL